MMAETKYMPDLNDNILKILLREPKSHHISGIIFHYLGKGGDGIVYKILVNNKYYCIKVFRTKDTYMLIKDFYANFLLQNIRWTAKNIVHSYQYNLSYDIGYNIMELMEGTLVDWVVQNITDKQITQKKRDRQWLEMIFQISHTIISMNKIGILHHDTKPKNIMYCKNDLNLIIDLNGKRYEMTEGFIFKMGNFSKQMIMGSHMNAQSDMQISQMIERREDLYELSKILNTIYIDCLIRKIDMNRALIIASKSAEFEMEYKKRKELIDRTMANYPLNVRSKFLLRYVLYEIIDRQLITRDDMNRLYNIFPPSQNIQDILERLLTEKNLFDLFINLEK